MTTRKSFLEALTKAWPAKVLSLVAAIFLFFFNRMGNLAQKYVSVPLEIRGLGELLPAQEHPRSVKLSLRGDPTALSFIEPSDLEAWIDLSRVTGEGRRTLPVMVTRLGAALEADPLEIRANPKQVVLELERRETREVPVEAVFRGRPEAGMEKVAHAVLPPTAMVSGPRSLVSALERLDTRPVDLSGLKEDASIRVGLSLPSSLLSFAGSSEVEVRVSLAQARAQRTFSAMSLEVQGLHSGLSAVGTGQTGSITLRGSTEDLRAVGASDSLLTVDLSGYSTPGTVTVPVMATAPAGLELVDWEPRTLTITIIPGDAR